MTTTQRETLYRRWRPGRLATVAGQEAVRTILANTARQNRLSHAYLLDGPRGTGKTTMARILAKLANCPNAEELGDACDECDHCIQISKGRHPDVMEIDAATNRTLEDIRNIQDYTRYLPSYGKRRVTTIDEVHALDHRAVPALLKTLEEPPPHAMFVLCTTESDKIPATILSRCQRHQFTRISQADITRHLARVGEAENIAVNDNELRAIARASQGGMRDALNLLEQLSFSAPDNPERLTAIGVYGDDFRTLPVIIAMLEGKTGTAIAALNEVVWEGASLNMIKSSGIEILRHAAFAANGEADAYPTHEAISKSVAALLENPEVTPARVMMGTKLWSEADITRNGPSTVGLELAIMETAIMGNSYPANAPTAITAVPSTPTAASATTPSSGNTPPLAQRTQPQPTPQVVTAEEMAPRWRKTMGTLNRVRAGDFWVGPLLRDVAASLVAQNEKGGLTLPFANRINLQRFQQTLESDEGDRVAAQIAEGTGTIAAELTLTIAARANSQQDGSTSAENGQQPTRQMQEPSELAKMALSLNGRLLRQ